MTSSGYRLHEPQIRAFALQVLAAIGMPDDDAQILTESILWSTRRGDVDHSLRRLDQIVRRAWAGGLKVKADWTPIRQHGGVTLMDAGAAWGPVAGTHGMRHAIAGARKFGVGVTVLRNADNTGALGWYPYLAASERMIGMSITDSGPMLPAVGGLPKPVIGNQAYAVGSPAGRHPPLIFDSALSVTWVQLRNAALRGEKIPLNVALNKRGEPTTDPLEGIAGMMLPIGGHRGFGLAIMWEVLTAALSGAGSLPNERGEMEELERPVDNSLFLLAIDPAAFIPYEQFTAHVDRLIDYIHSTPVAPGAEAVRVPGERGNRHAQRHDQEGTLFPEKHVEMLRVLAKELGVQWPPQ